MRGNVQIPPNGEVYHLDLANLGIYHVRFSIEALQVSV